jgi:hypothetical protein
MRVNPRRWLVLALVPVLCAASDATREVLPPPPPKFAPPSRGVLFADDFSKGLDAWTPDSPGVWTAVHGMARADLPDVKQQRCLLRTGDPKWRDYVLDFDVCMIRGVDKGAVVRLTGELGIGVDLRGGSYQDVVVYVREWPMGKGQAINPNATWNHVRIEVLGDRLKVFVNGDLALDHAVSRAVRGGIALAAYTGGSGQCTVYYDNVVVSTHGAPTAARE